MLSFVSAAPEPVSLRTNDSGEGGGGGEEDKEEEEEEEEVDFGYWEKAELPTEEPARGPETSGDSAPPGEQQDSSGKGTPLPPPPSRDMDLSLL